jgi:hypothetical protein
VWLWIGVRPQGLIVYTWNEEELVWTSAGGQPVSERPALDAVRGRIGRVEEVEEEEEKGERPAGGNWGDKPK